ncbi:MAG: hypothetical protein ACLFUK_09195 [Halanaerobium sp.]
MSNLFYYALIGVIIGLMTNYFNLSVKKSLILAVVIGGIAGILGTYIF